MTDEGATLAEREASEEEGRSLLVSAATHGTDDVGRREALRGLPLDELVRRALDQVAREAVGDRSRTPDPYAALRRLGELTPDRREALLARYAEGMTFNGAVRHLAESGRRSEDAARSLLNRAMRQFEGAG